MLRVPHLHKEEFQALAGPDLIRVGGVGGEFNLAVTTWLPLVWAKVRGTGLCAQGHAGPREWSHFLPLLRQDLWGWTGFDSTPSPDQFLPVPWFLGPTGAAILRSLWT